MNRSFTIGIVVGFVFMFALLSVRFEGASFIRNITGIMGTDYYKGYTCGVSQSTGNLYYSVRGSLTADPILDSTGEVVHAPSTGDVCTITSNGEVLLQGLPSKDSDGELISLGSVVGPYAGYTCDSLPSTGNLYSVAKGSRVKTTILDSTGLPVFRPMEGTCTVNPNGSILVEGIQLKDENGMDVTLVES